MSINELAGTVSEINYENYQKKQEEYTDDLLETFKKSNLANAVNDVKGAFDFMSMSAHVPYLNKMYELKVKHLRNAFKKNKDTTEDDSEEPSEQIQSEGQPPPDVEMSDFSNLPKTNRTTISQGEEPSTTSTQDSIMDEDGDVSNINDIESVGDLPTTNTPQVISNTTSELDDVAADLGEAAVDSSIFDDIPVVGVITGVLGLASIVMEGIESSKDDDKPPTIPIPEAQLTSGFQSGISG